MIAKPKKEIRVRIAPSPTGYLHIGTARTALFNWLFAKKEGGKFILRIEDTDLERSDPKFEKDIIESLKWLGLDWDEGPFRQSERLDIYEKYINQLLESGHAYYCFCTKEELEMQRQSMMAQGLAPKYSGKCRILTETEVKKKLKAGDSHIIRFKIPEVKVAFEDIIRGEISFDGSLIGDIAIAKDPQVPLYNFAVVVDDQEMSVSHVIRGEDHIANTPKQIFIQKALSFPQPEYAHLPLILDPDRSKMSKRFSATAISEYRQQGYLPDALVNFIALLGWHPHGDKEIMSRQELIQGFDLQRLQKAGAVFNVAKLNWINAQYLKNLSDDELAKLLGVKKTAVVALVRERMQKLSDFEKIAGFFFKLPDYPSDLLIWREALKEKTAENLKEVLNFLPDAGKIMQLANERGKGEVLWPLRVALSGKEASPGPLEIMEALGKTESVKRIKIAIEKLQGN